MSKAQRIAVIGPRFPEGGTVGGAETLLKNLAERAQLAGREVTYLTTCAQDHFTWENTLPPGRRDVNGMQVEYFPVDENRNVELFIKVQNAISNSSNVTRAEEEAWIANSVNSQALYSYLQNHGDAFDRILIGPYLFGVTYFASLIHPAKTFLVPCLHDEPFAYLSIMEDLFGSVVGCLFNTEPERDLAKRLFDVPDSKAQVVGMGLDPFDADEQAFARNRNIESPYVLYSGRREPLKGTPLLVDYLGTFRQRTGRDIKFVATGSGPIPENENMKGHIVDVGFVSEQEKHDAMAGALAFCHPSVNESLGIVLLESWLAGTPALVHARGEVLRWQCANSGGGMWFRNYPDFEEELVQLMDDAELRKSMGEAGKRYVHEQYSWTSVEKRLFQAID